MFLFVTGSLVKMSIPHCLEILAKWIRCCCFKLLVIHIRGDPSYLDQWFINQSALNTRLDISSFIVANTELESEAITNKKSKRTPVFGIRKQNQGQF